MMIVFDVRANLAFDGHSDDIRELSNNHGHAEEEDSMTTL